MPSYAEAQNIAQRIYLKARDHALRAIAKAIEEIDRLHAADAESIKRAVKRMNLGALPAKRIDKAIDDVLMESRGRRIAVVEKAITDAAVSAHAVDQDTFHQVFSKEEAASPFVVRKSALRRSKTPLLRLVSASEASSVATV